MYNSNSKNKISHIHQETIQKLQKFTKKNSNSQKITFENLINKLNSSAQNDEKFILMLISTLHKKCSSELLLALLYIIS